MRLLVVGASGLVGGEIARRARRLGHAVTGAARHVQGGAEVQIDLTDWALTEAVVSRTHPDAIVICSAWPWVDGCELDPARSHRENVETVANVIRATSASPATLVYFSTDHVFDGSQPFNVESDRAHPLNVYARHKRESEELLLSRGQALIAQTAWVFGAEARQKNFLYQVTRAARVGGSMTLPVGQAGCPTWSGWLADSTLTLLGSGVEGIVHLTGAELLTKAEWARLLTAELGLPASEIDEVSAAGSGQTAPRPLRVTLRSERHGLVQPPLRDILRANRVPLLSSEPP